MMLSLHSKKLNLVKTVLMFSAAVILSGCGGGGGSDSTATTNNKAPFLIEASSADSSSLQLIWEAVQDGKTVYQVYLSESPSFTPSSATLKKTLANQTATLLTGLKVATIYYVQIVAVDESGLTVHSQELPTSTAPKVGTLNDTGITWCSNANTNFSVCSAANLGGLWKLNQDGEVGRDSVAIAKVGGGDGGFDFTKISATGKTLPVNSTVWRCVKDNHTGLMWEVKTDDRGLSDKYKTYTWYNTDITNNGGAVGYANNGNNTQAFVQAVNAQSLCGFADWRLPSVQELRSIVNYGKYTPPAIDSAYFPNTNSNYYWSSSPMAANSDIASVINFGDNEGSNVGGINKSNNLYVRLVRSR